MDIQFFAHKISELSYETLVSLLLKPMNPEEREVILMRLLDMNHQLLVNKNRIPMPSPSTVPVRDPQREMHIQREPQDLSRTARLSNRRKDLSENEHPAMIAHLNGMNHGQCQGNYQPIVPMTHPMSSHLTPSPNNYDMSKLSENIIQDNFSSPNSPAVTIRDEMREDIGSRVPPQPVLTQSVLSRLDKIKELSNKLKLNL
jgi:hypothetical protein